MSRTLFITGANSGIGLATTSLFLAKGWRVVATARDPAASNELAELKQVHGDQILLVKLDYTRPDTFQPAIDAAVAQYGKIDVLANNAGFGQWGMMEALEMDDYRRSFEVNVFGPIALTKAMLPHLLATGDPSAPPSVLFTSSGAAHFGVPFMSAYNASKAALDLFAEGLSWELSALAPLPVRVKLVVPHGGVAGTRFAASSNAAPVPQAMAASPGLLARHGAYAQAFLGRIVAAQGAGVPVEGPAEKMWEAATDGNGHKMRYFVGPEGAGGGGGGENMEARLGGWRAGDSLDEADERYITSMRSRFSFQSLVQE